MLGTSILEHITRPSIFYRLYWQSRGSSVLILKNRFYFFSVNAWDHHSVLLHVCNRYTAKNKNLKGRLGVQCLWCECPLPFLLLHGVSGVEKMSPLVIAPEWLSWNKHMFCSFVTERSLSIHTIAFNTKTPLQIIVWRQIAPGRGC